MNGRDSQVLDALRGEWDNHLGSRAAEINAAVRTRTRSGSQIEPPLLLTAVDPVIPACTCGVLTPQWLRPAIPLRPRGWLLELKHTSKGR
jgi:hypothetical protein